MNRMEPIPGLKSINEKLRQLEGLLISVATEVRPSQTKSTIEQFHDDIQKSKQQRTLDNLTKMKSEFERDLIKEMAGRNVTKSISRICEFAVGFIENNISKIASVLDVKITSDLKLSTCVNFIKSVVAIFDETDLVNCINHFVEIMFPKEEKQEKQEPVATSSNAIVSVKHKKKVHFKF